MTTPTETEKRVLIAQSLNWEYDEDHEQMIFMEDGQISGVDWPSLDAMHLAEKAIPANKRAQYIREVHALIKKSDEQEWHELHATATQRAEAFGITLGLWS